MRPKLRQLGIYVDTVLKDGASTLLHCGDEASNHVPLSDWGSANKAGQSITNGSRIASIMPGVSYPALAIANGQWSSLALGGGAVAAPCTMEQWIKCPSFHNIQWWDTNTGLGGVYFTDGGDAIAGVVGNHSSQAGITAADFPFTWVDNTLYHVVMKVSGTVLTLYVNGVIVGTQDTGLANIEFFGDAGDQQITFGAGGAQGNPSSNFTGDLQMFALYKTALSDAKVLDHYNKGISSHR